MSTLYMIYLRSVLAGDVTFTSLLSFDEYEKHSAIKFISVSLNRSYIQIVMSTSDTIFPYKKVYEIFKMFQSRKILHTSIHVHV